MCGPKRQQLPALSTALGTLAGFSMGFAAPLLNLLSVEGRRLVCLCEVPQQSPPGLLISVDGWSMTAQLRTGTLRYHSKVHLVCYSP